MRHVARDQREDADEDQRDLGELVDTERDEQNRQYRERRHHRDEREEGAEERAARAGSRPMLRPARSPASAASETPMRDAGAGSPTCPRGTCNRRCADRARTSIRSIASAIAPTDGSSLSCGFACEPQVRGPQVDRGDQDERQQRRAHIVRAGANSPPVGAHRSGAARAGTCGLQLAVGGQLHVVRVEAQLHVLRVAEHACRRGTRCRRSPWTSRPCRTAPCRSVNVRTCSIVFFSCAPVANVAASAGL